MNSNTDDESVGETSPKHNGVYQDGNWRVPGNVCL
jgi:hypothetical protein